MWMTKVLLLESITYPDDFTVNYEYDPNTGAFYKATSGNTVLYEMKTVNHLGQVTGYEYNNGTIPVEHTYNEFGMPNTTKAKNGTLFNWQYNFNKNNGNLNNRRDVKNNKYESFKYDNLHRLTHVNNTEVAKYTYNGNIDYKQDAGNYTYSQPNNKINAVTGISNDNNTIPLLTECITYTAFDRPESIVEGNKSYELYYGIDHQRTKSVYTDNGKTTTRYYNGAYELIDGGICGISKSIYHLSFANSVDVIYYKEKIVSNDCRDYLGSILKVVDGDGNTKEEQSFDAWGRKRNPTNWQVYNEPAEALPQTLTWLKRGYTGHEHIYQFGIINMNNRLYDPIVGRMLAVDNFVADSGSTQAFNRYSYAMNNPLKYTDPSGEWVNFVVGAVVGGIVNVVDQALKGNITSFGEGLAYFGVGAGAGLLVASGNIAAARVLTAGGNKAVQLVTGKFDPTGIDSFGDVASLALDVGTDLLAPDLTKVVSKVITKKIALKALAKTAGSAAANNTIKVAGSTLAEKAGGEVAKGIAFNAVAKEGWGVTAKAVDRASRLALHNAGKIGYRAITRGNFRHNLSKLTGINPKGFEAHHIFPHQFKEKFAKIGFDANNPIFGAWFEKGAHRAAHNAGNYNQLWQEFLQQPNLTVDKTLQFGKDLMSNYGNFNFLF